MMKDFFDRPWVYRVISLGLAVLLFMYVQNNGLGSTFSGETNKEQTAVADTKITMSVALQVDADVDKYFVTGYPEKVDLTIEGSTALVAAAKNTHNFRAYIDLRDLKTGTHTVKIKVSGLNKSLTYSIKPSTTKVKIQTRSDRTFPIQAKYKSNRVADGYLVGTPVISPETVRVSGAKSEVSRVRQVVAQLDLSANANSNYEQEVLLQAYDKDGKTVDVLLTPQTAHVKLPIYLPTKKMKITFKQSGTGVSGRTYAFSSSVTEVTVSAPQSVLTELASTLTVPVNVNGVSNSTQQTVNIPKSTGVVAADPTAVSVNITVTQDNDDDDEAAPSSSSSSSSASSSSSSSTSSSSSSESEDNQSSSSSSDSVDSDTAD